MSCIEFARYQGLEKGIEEGILITATKMKVRGLSAEDISACTGLSVEEISKL